MLPCDGAAVPTQANKKHTVDFLGLVLLGFFAPAVAPLGVAVLFWVSAANSGLPLPAWFPCPCPPACPPAPFSWASPQSPAAERPGPTRDIPPARRVSAAISRANPSRHGRAPARCSHRGADFFFFFRGVSLLITGCPAVASRRGWEFLGKQRSQTQDYELQSC